MARGQPSLRPWEEVGLDTWGSERELQRLGEADAAALKLAGLKLVDEAPAVEPATEAAVPDAAAPEETDQPLLGSSSGGQVSPG